MPFILIVVVLLLLLVGPGLWVRRTMKKYSQPENRYPDTGARVARRLLEAEGLGNVKVEETEKGDHYDPIAKVVRLTPPHFSGRSLTAVTVAAHEVGHAIQDARDFRPLKWRTRFVRWVSPVERLGAGMMMAAPLLVAITRAPVAGLLTFGGGFLTLGSGVAVHALTLPTEFDASFGRALPLMARHKMLHEGDEYHARKILWAAAMTYVAGSLMSLLNVARWWAILRR